MKYWRHTVGAPSAARIAAGSFRVLLMPLTYMAQASLSTGSRSHLLLIGEAAPTVTIFAMIGYIFFPQVQLSIVLLSPGRVKAP